MVFPTSYRVTGTNTLVTCVGKFYSVFEGGVDLNLLLQQKRELKNVEVEIRYPRMTEQVSRMVQFIKQCDIVIEGFNKDEIRQISLDQIYYMETADRKTFIYLEQQVYESRKTILALETILEGSTIVRIGKSTLLNISMVKNVKPYPNHRILVELNNGENIIVSRKYILALKERIRRAYGE